MAETIPPLPAGFTLDQSSGVPPLPEGFVLDSVIPPKQATGIDKGKLGRFKQLLIQQAKGDISGADEIKALQSELTSQQQARPEIIRPEVQKEEQPASFIADMFTGENRMTPELESMKSIGSAPEFNEFSGASLKANLATFTTDNQEELKKILKKQYGEKVSFSKDSKGNDIVNFPSGQYALNKPGISAQDVPKFFGDVAAFTPAGRAGTISGAAVKSGLGETALEGADVALGGDFSLIDVAESTVLGGAFKYLEQGAKSIYSYLKSIPDEIPATREAIRQSIKESATDEALASVSEAIKKGANDDLAALVDADPKFYQAADELGINTEPLASFASKNPQFVAVESGLASVPSSQLDAQAKEFIKETARKADDLIEQYGGTLDKGHLNIEFKRKSLETIEELAEQADEVYGSIATQIKKSERFAAPETVGFLNELAKDLGGTKELPAKLKVMLNSLSKNPTLGKIDQLRREIGQAINKNSGSFKDVESGLNKALYARLSADQETIAKSAGLENITKSAKALITQRKQLEDNLTTLLGKDLSKSLSVSIGGAMKGLAKGDIGRFNKVLNAIPKKSRPEVIMTAMNDVFKGSGVNQQSLSPTQFVKWYESVKRSPEISARLFGELPKDSKKAINNLYIVSKGISNATGEMVTTGRLNTMFNEDTGFLRRLVGRVAPYVVAISTGSPTASVMTSSTMEFLKQSTNGAKKASDLLSSQEFRDLIKKSVAEGVLAAGQASKAAEKRLTKTMAFKNWQKSLSKEQKESLGELGVLRYLFGVTDTERGGENE